MKTTHRHRTRKNTVIVEIKNLLTKEISDRTSDGYRLIQFKDILHIVDYLGIDTKST